MAIDLVTIVVIIGLVLNVLVTIFLLSRADLGKSQKVGQIVIVWLIPLLGAIGIWLLNKSHDDRSEASKRPFGGGPADSGYGVGDGGGGGTGTGAGSDAGGSGD